MPKSEAFNCDCMEYMKSLPNNAFDLAICDPPYGGGFTEGGGCQGWFSKYHQNDCSQSVQVEREREREREQEPLQPIQEPRKPIRAVQVDRLHSTGRKRYWTGTAGGY